MEKIYNSIHIQVPYKKAGNVIIQKFVDFDVYQQDEIYILVPLISEEERRIANLPPELKFTLVNGRPQSMRGKMDGNFHIIEDAVHQLQKGNFLSQTSA